MSVWHLKEEITGGKTCWGSPWHQRDCNNQLMFKRCFQRKIPMATQGTSTQIPSWIWVHLPSKPQNKLVCLDRSEVKMWKIGQWKGKTEIWKERTKLRYRSNLKEINESTSFSCWKRQLSLKSERKEFSLENMKDTLHLILLQAQNCSGLLSSSKQTEKQQAKARNGSSPLRGAPVLPQLKDMSPGHLNSELHVFPLHLNFHLSDVTTPLKTEFESGTRNRKSHHSGRSQPYNAPTPNKMTAKQFKPLLKPLADSEVAGGYGPAIWAVSAGINHSSPFLRSSIPPAQLTVLSLRGTDSFKHKQFIFASCYLSRGIPKEEGSYSGAWS